MKRIKLIIKSMAIIFIAMLILPSCVSTKYFYQVYEVKSDDVPVVNERFEFNNDDLVVRYNFCKEDGDVTFLCYNKTDKTIFIQLDNSFYKRNGIAYDYYKDCSYTTSVASSFGAQTQASATKTLSGNVNYYNKYPETSISRTNEIGYYNSISGSKSVTNYAPRIIAIPPQSAKYINGFIIQDRAILRCGEEMYKQNYPKRSSSLFTYNNEDTPIVFSNYISYSFTQDGADMQSFENTFYVSSIRNLAEKEVLKPNYEYDHGNEFDNQFSRSKDVCATNNRYSFIITSPMEFYVIYTK